MTFLFHAIHYVLYIRDPRLSTCTRSGGGIRPCSNPSSFASIILPRNLDDIHVNPSCAQEKPTQINTNKYIFRQSETSAMVLKNSYNSETGESMNDTPSSYANPYADSASVKNIIDHMDLSKLPGPWPVLGSLFGYNEKFFRESIKAKLTLASIAVGRQLSQEEIESFSYWTAKHCTIGSYGSPIGVAGGLWRAYRTAENLRFPFWTPRPQSFSLMSFPFKTGPIRGSWAILCWHALRVGAYSISGSVMGSIFFESYSRSVVTIGQSTDLRLQTFMADAREKLQSKRRQFPSIEKPLPDDDENVQKAGQAIFGSGEDDASPTEGRFSDGSEPEIGARNTTSNSAKPRSERPWPVVKPIPIEPREVQSTSFDDDNPPPTGRQGIATDMVSGSKEESAWEKIRRVKRLRKAASQEAPPGNTWAKKIYDTTSQDGESFEFSKADEEHAYAKNEAQEEFDARVESERQGRQFNTGRRG